MSNANQVPSRRQFVKRALLAGSLLPLVSTPLPSAAERHKGTAGKLSVHVFSKHLQFLNYRDMADAAAELGFDGIDLTVRPKGHVLPERVADDLPRAVEAIRKAGLKHSMMTTAVEDAFDPTDQKVVETASREGIKFYRMNWLRYPDDKSIPEAVNRFQKVLKELGELNRKHDIVGCYQNHSGNLAGASLWELWDMVQDADKHYTGVQYDIRHGVVEGGLSWKNGFRLIHPHIRILAIKDFVWEKREHGYAVKNVPLGEGMVDFKSYFKLLKEYGIDAPVSLHFEYPLGGAERGGFEINIDRKVVFAAMKKDLQWLHRMWNE